MAAARQKEMNESSTVVATTTCVFVRLEAGLPDADV
jgi:hypothetical protein